MKEAATIYVLLDPRTGEIRYVGYTSLPLAKRLRHHLSGITARTSVKKNAWLRELRGRGLEPEIVKVQEVPKGEWAAAEVYWVKYFTAAACPLTNGNPGGVGGALGSGKGKTISPEHRLAVSLAGKRRWEQWRAAGAYTSDETRQRIRESKRGLKASSTTKQKMRDARKGKSLSEDHKFNISQALQDRPKTQEHRAKTMKQFMKVE